MRVSGVGWYDNAVWLGDVTAEGLAVHHHVGLDVVELLSAKLVHPEAGVDLVEDEGDVELLGHLW